LRRGFVFNKDDYQDWDFIVNLSMGYGKNKYVYLICNAISYLLTGNEVNVDKKPVIDLLLELVNSFNGIDSFEEIKRAANVKLLCVELIKYLNFSGIDKIEEIDKIEDFVLKTVISSTNTKDTVIKTSSLANYYWVKYISKKNMSKHIRNIYLSGNAYIACQFLSDIEDIKKVDNELLIEAINKNTYPNEARIMFEHISSVKLRKLSRGNTKGKK